jgi:hypothetical protein
MSYKLIKTENERYREGTRERKIVREGAGGKETESS